jgi:hypothetical protein
LTLTREFLSPGAGAEINIDGKTMEETKLAMKNPSRWECHTECPSWEGKIYYRISFQAGI